MIGWLVALVIGVWVLHRLLLAAEARGWINYRHRPMGAGSYALTSLEVLMRPELEHVIEARDFAAIDVDVIDVGAPPRDEASDETSDVKPQKQ